MARQTRTNILGRIAKVRDAFLPGVNTALIIGGLLIDMFDSQPNDWSELEPYSVGDKVIFRGMIYTCLTATAKGESPATAAAKWDNFLASKIDQVNDVLPDYPVTQKLLAAYVKKMLPPNGGGGVVPVKATDAQFNEGKSNDTFTTPRQIALLKAAIIDGTGVPEFDFDSMREGYFPVVRKQVDDSLIVVWESPDQTLARLLKAPSATTRALFCALVSACAINPEEDLYEVIDVLRLISTTTPTTPAPSKPDYILNVDSISCDRVSGWGCDRNNVSVPQEFDIFINNELADSITAHIARKDVADSLQTNVSYLFGFEYIIPAKYRVGKALQIRVFIRDTKIEANVYATSQTTAACGTAPTSPTPAPAPYVIQSRLDGPYALYEGGDELVWYITDRYNNDAEQVRTGGVDSWEILEGKPAGLVMTPFENNSKLKMKLNDLDFTKKLTLRARLTGGGYCDAGVQMVDTTCHRPDGLGYKPQLVYAFAPASGGNARGFNTLDDAISVMTAHFDGSAPALFTPFKAEMANYDNGTDAWLNWSETDNSCAHTDDRIFYVLSGDKTNGQLIAIQVAGGKIVASKRVPVSDSSVTRIGYGYVPIDANSVGDLFVFAANGIQPPAGGGIDGNTAPTYGFQTGNQSLSDNYAMGSIASAIGQIPRWDKLLREAQQAGYVYYGRTGVEQLNQSIPFRARGRRSEVSYKQYTFVVPSSNNVTVSLTQIFPSVQ